MVALVPLRYGTLKHAVFFIQKFTTFLLKSHVVFGHLFISRPVVLTRFASAVEPVLLFQVGLSFVLDNRCEDRSIVLGNFFTLLDVLYSTDNNVCTDEISVKVIKLSATFTNMFTKAKFNLPKPKTLLDPELPWNKKLPLSNDP